MEKRDLYSRSQHSRDNAFDDDEGLPCEATPNLLILNVHRGYEKKKKMSMEEGPLVKMNRMRITEILQD